MSDYALMAGIKASYGMAIEAAVKDYRTPPPAAFLAALVANESGGDADASRFEPHVFGLLGMLLARRIEEMPGGLTVDVVQQRVLGTLGQIPTAAAIADRLLDLATSWGLTQIMGYRALQLHISTDDLKIPGSHLCAAAEFLQVFCARPFQLNLSMPDAATAEKFFRCWNTGKPDGQTADPNYVRKGFARMAIYMGLA